MIWRCLVRILFMFLAPLVLFLPTIYAQIRGLNRLPWGLDSIFGCEEDGWNGNGIDPNNPRQGWEEGVKGKWIEEEDRVPSKKYQGWWPDYKGVKWSKLNGLKQWWLGYQWCAFRNVGWNLRLKSSFGTSIDYKDIVILYLRSDSKTREVTVEWRDAKGKEFSFKRKKFLGVLWEFGWEFYPEIFLQGHPVFERIRKHGYTRGWKYKNRSIPSIRPRR